MDPEQIKMAFALSVEKRPGIELAAPVLIKNRYEIRNVLGRGGMGVVYKAFDALMRREVAVKTLRDVASSVFVDLFYRECSVLTAMVHPNIVEIFDMGEFEEDGVMKPYFVMPLLPGRTLYDLIYPSGKSLPVERCTDIISQACRGLHAAHECGLLHRDIKPRNIFVMRDDAVKLIDFGVVRLLGHQTIGAPGMLGTLHYMAPEQISMKPLTARSDIFSLATVCYEALTGVQPFVRENETETAAAVAEHTPVLISQLNPLVNKPLAQAVAQAMAKDPRNRFESAAAFADALQRGLRNERPGASLLTNPQNRLARAQRSFARGDYEFTQEIVEQLEAEGADGPEVEELRIQLADAVRKRQAEVQFATARRYFEEEEHVLALRRVTEVLAANPSHEGAAALRTQIEDKLNEQHISDSLKRAVAYLGAGEFTDARRLIESTLELRPGHAEALRLLAETEQRAKDWPLQRQQQEELFQAAQAAYFEGRFDASIRALDQLADMTQKSKAAGTRIQEYVDFHKRVRVDFDALQSMLADARKLLSNEELENAFALSERLREQFPQDQDVRALSKEVAARRESKEQDYRRGILGMIENEPDLSTRLHILNQAVRSRPTDEYFHQERMKLQARLQQITDLVQRAQVYEASGRFEYAIEEWLCVGDLYPEYPGLPDQLARVKGAWKNSREQAKTELRSKVTEAVKRGDQRGAAQFLKAAETDFRDDPDFGSLQGLVQTAADAHKQVNALLQRLQQAEKDRSFSDIPDLSKRLASLSQEIDPLRVKAFESLVGTASRLAGRNWRVADRVTQEAARLGAVPAPVLATISQQRREEEVNGILGEDRTGHANLEAYRERVAAMFEQYPDETRLEERLRLIDAALVDKRLQDERRSCGTELALMCRELCDTNDHRRLWDTYIRAKNFAAPFSDDHEVAQNLEAIREQSSQFEEAAHALTRDRVKDCFAVCDYMLAKYPGHVLFQKVRSQAEDRHHLLGEEYFARVERWLASEPDVYQRELILQKAKEEFPFETRYDEELRELQREKSIAESIAAKARDFEKRGQVAEAVGQWRQLRNLHPTYPDLQEQITRCETILDRAQRKTRAQRLLAQGETHLTEGYFAQGYQMVHEASELSHDIPELLRHAAPLLAAGAREAVAASPKLAEAMMDLAQRLDEELRVPKDIRARINEARRIEELTEALDSIQAKHKAGDLGGALAVADEYLHHFPGVRQIESARARLLWEIEQERKQDLRHKTLNQFREMELSAAGMGPSELLRLRQSVQEIGRHNSADEEIIQRATTLDSLFSSLSEVRGFLRAGDSERAEEACQRALDKFPDHPLFKSALGEVDKQHAAATANDLAEIHRLVSDESDPQKQAGMLRDALGRFPDEPSLLAELAAVNANQAVLDGRIEKARSFERKRLFGEAIKEWEGIGHDYPWFTAVEREVERLGNVRRKDKQDAHDRWLRQVEEAIDSGDYDSAGTMLRQAAQQQPDRQLQGLEAKLKAALKNKADSDAKFAEGRQLLANGDLNKGALLLNEAFELQPRNQERSNAIGQMLTEKVRASMSSDRAASEALLEHLQRVRPNQPLPADIQEAFRKEKPRRTKKTNSVQLLDLVHETQATPPQRNSAPAKDAARPANPQESPDLDTRRVPGDMLRKINTSLSVGETAIARRSKEEPKPSRKGVPLGAVITAVLLLLALAGIVFFLTRTPHKVTGLPVVMSVEPDHTLVEVDGQTCVTPNCNLFLKPGDYLVKLRKDGYLPRDIFVPVKPRDRGPVNLSATLQSLDTPTPAFNLAGFAKLTLQGAAPGTRVRMDSRILGEVSKEGLFTVYITPGVHTIDLSLDGFANRTFTRTFVKGETISLAKDDVRLERNQSNVHPAN